MKNISMIKPFILLSCGLLVTSCSDMNKKTTELSDQEACAQLKGMVSDHRNQFKKYKKSLRKARTLNTWSAIKVFPTAQTCQIWEWSSGLHSYICNWPAQDGKQMASEDYNKGNQLIKQCLGEKWTSTSKPTKSGGESTVYSNPASKTVIGIRYLKESRSWLEKWQTVVTIGDQSNLKAKIQ